MREHSVCSTSGSPLAKNVNDFSVLRKFFRTLRLENKHLYLVSLNKKLNLPLSLIILAIEFENWCPDPYTVLSSSN